MNISLLEPLGVPEELIQELAEPIKKAGHSFTYYSTKTTDLEELKKRTKGQEVVMIANNKYPREVIESADKLRLIAVAFTGIDHVDTEACKEKGIAVANCSGYSNICVAEQAVGMAISLLRFFPEGDSTVRSGGTSQGLTGTELGGKRVGIIGCGEIGTMTAKLFLAFGCDVVAYARHERPLVKALGVKYVPLDELLSTSDIVSLHTPNNASTKGMIGKRELSLMKKTAIFINCARGPIVDNQALSDALNEGLIAGAGIDVFDMEPPLAADYPLLHAKNTLLTPHVAYLTKEAMVRRAHIEFSNVLAYLEGKPQNICEL